MDRENVLRKIRKLLDMANAKKIANQAEAEAALQKAQKMMVEYTVSEVEVSCGVQVKLEDEIIKKTIVEQARKSMEEKYFVGLLPEFFNVRAIWGRKPGADLHLVGSESNILIAENVYWYLRRIYRCLWLKYYYSLERWERSTGLKQTFYHGLHDGLEEKLEASQKEINSDEKVCTALALSKAALMKKTVELFPYLKKTRWTLYSIFDSGAYNSGVVQGRNINIHKGVASGIRGTAKALPSRKSRISF